VRKQRFISDLKVFGYYYFLVILPFLVLILPGNVISVPKVYSATDAVRWTAVNIPTGGNGGDWVLADGSDIRCITAAADGSIYAYVTGNTYTLYRSTDGGTGWSHLGTVRDTIVGIAVSPVDTDRIYYATSSAVYRSTDGGRTFGLLAEGPGGSGTLNVEITSIDVACLDENIVAIGTMNADSSGFGGVYTLDEKETIPFWVDTNIGSFDVYAVAFSPDYVSDGQLVAVITDETDTLVSAKTIGSGWGVHTGNALLDKDNSGVPSSVAVSAPAVVAFPDNYEADPASGNSVLFIGIITGTDEGDVYKISFSEALGSSTATDLDAGYDYGYKNIDISGLDACGDARDSRLLAGAADSADTFFSADGGQSWTSGRKGPTGGNGTLVLMAADFDETGTVYAATGGSDSAFSVSRDSGNTWNQVSLIDTAIESMVDFSPSPRYDSDKTLFLLTFDGNHSLWRSLNGGSTWERIYSGTLSGVDTISLVELSPQYGQENHTLYFSGMSGGKPAVWKSTDNGQTFKCRLTRDPATGDPFAVDTWVVVDDDSFFIGSYNGSAGLVYLTENSGFSYSEPVRAGAQSLHSISLSPDYENDKTLLVGNINGWAYMSDDNGASFKSLPAGTASHPLSGMISVAFDSSFAENRTVYAASENASIGVVRFIVGTSSDWENIDSTLPDNAALHRLVAAEEGTLYITNSRADAGMERCLDPTHSPGPTFEAVNRGLGEGATLFGLWRYGHRLWSLDTTNDRLMTFNDTLTSPVAATSPDNLSSGTGNLIDHTIKNISLNWDTTEGATGYRWQLNHDDDLSTVPAGFEDSTEASSVRLPDLEPATTYFWRVRANAPVLGPWSEKRSFTTGMDTETFSLNLEFPRAGATGVPVRPVFQWADAGGADAYELLVSKDAGFTSPSIKKLDDFALPDTAWQCDLSLDYATTYYWKVRAINASTRSAWSGSVAFTTESIPSVEATESGNEIPVEQLSPSTELPPSGVTPSPAVPEGIVPPASEPTETAAPAVFQTMEIPAWTLYLIAALLLIITLALAIILTLVIRTSHL